MIIKLYNYKSVHHAKLEDRETPWGQTSAQYLSVYWSEDMLICTSWAFVPPGATSQKPSVFKRISPQCGSWIGKMRMNWDCSPFPSSVACLLQLHLIHTTKPPLKLLFWFMFSPQDSMWDGGGQAQPACWICGNLRGRMQTRVHGQVFTALLLYGKLLWEVLLGPEGPQALVPFDAFGHCLWSYSASYLFTVVLSTPSCSFHFLSKSCYEQK